MKLKKVEIKEFRSIRDSGEFEVGDVTCLVGKNESGKTALLQALYKLNPVVTEHGSFDITDEYPRSDVEEYRSLVEDDGVALMTPFTASVRSLEVGQRAFSGSSRFSLGSVHRRSKKSR
ncbi:AAA family ATPase [Rubinisphaera sp.]|uniref:AAA family ATPase n=1 Tax=Rubinisphaera sp. TaxID=2024857 RepID=UPI0025D7761C|nr:AAA family ATPase [Rubinisphaera sp.]